MSQVPSHVLQPGPGDLDPTTAPDPPVADAPAPDAPAEPAEPAGRIEAGLQAGLQAERAKRQALEAKLAAIEELQAQAAKDKLVRTGKFEELYGTANTELGTLRAAHAAKSEAYEQLEGIVNATISARVAALPEAHRPPIDGLDIGKQLELVAWAERSAGQSTYPMGTRTVGGDAAGAGVIPEACIAEAKQHNQDPQFWYESIWKPRVARQKAGASKSGHQR